MNHTLVLASSSIYRQNQLRQFTQDFITISPNIDESPKTDENPKRLAARLSEEKARIAFTMLNNKITDALEVKPNKSIVVACDQTAVVDGIILGKPLSQANAIKQLELCSGKNVRFYSSISVSDNGASPKTDVVETQIHFRHLSHEEIIAYVEAENPIHCAGGFKCESRGLALFESVSSNDPSALIGLPLIALNNMLRELGINLLMTNDTNKNKK